jgi:hypothetical protein
MMQGLLLHNAQVSGAGSTQSKGQTLASFDGWHLGSNAQLQMRNCNQTLLPAATNNPLYRTNPKNLLLLLPSSPLLPVGAARLLLHLAMAAGAHDPASGWVQGTPHPSPAGA